MAIPDLEVVRGTLDLLVLKTLSWGPMHGLGVLRWIESGSQGKLQIEEGALYPALHRMEQKGWLESDWGYSDQGRKARFYHVTAAGKKHLAAEVSRWTRYTDAVGLILATEPPR